MHQNKLGRMYESMHKMTPHNFDCKIVYNSDTKSVNYDAKMFYINDNIWSC